MKVAIYARVSLEEIERGQNPENQLMELREFVKRKGWEIYKEYVDRISGAKESRPALNDLMNDARHMHFKAVVVWKLDRLGRSLAHLIQIINEWQKLGVDFICLTQPIDTTTPGGKLIFYIFGAIAEFERDLIRERTLAGIKRARKEGKRIGRPKLSKYHRNLIINLYQKGYSMRRISKEIRVSYGSVHKVVKEWRNSHPDLSKNIPPQKP